MNRHLWLFDCFQSNDLILSFRLSRLFICFLSEIHEIGVFLVGKSGRTADVQIALESILSFRKTSVVLQQHVVVEVAVLYAFYDPFQFFYVKYFELSFSLLHMQTQCLFEQSFFNLEWFPITS